MQPAFAPFRRAPSAAGVPSASAPGVAPAGHLRHIHAGQASFYANRGKRALDLVIALALLPVVVPVMAVIWGLVRRGGAAAVFGQARVGRHGRVFTCLKFRTMVPCAETVLEELCGRDPRLAEEWRRNQKLRNDPRITPVGRILRQTSLDELPQIFNVIRGDMSLVGPRPFLPSQGALYEAAGGRAYYTLRPGMTGPWQVFGRHDTGFIARVGFDEAYAASYSAPEDLALLIQTARTVLSRTGA